MSGWLGLSFVLLVLMGLPVSIAIGIAAIIAALIVNPGLLTAFPSMMYGALDSFLLVAIPLFMITGFIMEKGGTSQRIFDFAESLVGWMRGGLGAVNVVGSLIFGGISGSSVADAAGLGPIEINAMGKERIPIGIFGSPYSCFVYLFGGDSPQYPNGNLCDQRQPIGRRLFSRGFIAGSTHGFGYDFI